MEKKIRVEKIKRAIEARTAGNDDGGTQAPLDRLEMCNTRAVLHMFIEDLNDCQMAFLYHLRIDLRASEVNLPVGNLLDKALDELLPGKARFEERLTDLCGKYLEEKNLSYWDYGNPMRDALLAFGMILGAKAAGACDQKLKALAEAIAGQQDENRNLISMALQSSTGR